VHDAPQRDESCSSVSKPCTHNSILADSRAGAPGHFVTTRSDDPLGLTQPTISHHLKILVDAGIVSQDKRGKWAYYTIVSSALDAISAALHT